MSLTVDDILTPLAICVIVDHKVRDAEQSAFVERAQGLLDFFGLPTMTGEQLQAWFAANEASLGDQLWDKGGNTLVLKSLAKFSADDAAREAIYDALVSISVADGEYAMEESRLVKSAASIYGFQRPPIKVSRD